MNDDVTPVAARIRTPQRQVVRLETDANLHVDVGPATRRFHIWQQVPAWLLGFAAIGLGFLMVLRGYDSSAGWFAVSTGILLAVIGSYRSPFTIGETSLSTAPGRHPRPKKVTPPPPPTPPRA